MNCKIIVRIIAILFVVPLIWKIGLSLWMSIYLPPHQINLTIDLNIIFDILYLCTASGLFYFKNSWRKLAVCILFLNAVIPVLLILLALVVQAGLTFHINISPWEWQPLKPENYYMLAMWSSIAIIDILAMLFLLQKRTRELFITEEKPSVESEQSINANEEIVK